MPEFRIWNKPTMACLTTHQSKWKEKAIRGGDYDGMEITFCEWCKQLFRYPTKKEDNPVYYVWKEI